MGNEIRYIEREILKSFRAGVLVLGGDGDILYVNEIGKRILNLSEEREKVSTRDPFFRVLLASLHSEYLPSRVELESKRGRDKKIIGITLSEIKKKGKRVAIVAFFKDLSSIEKISEAESVKSRLVTLGQMAANMAHEIRNPLASIKLFTQRLKKRIPPELDEGHTDLILQDVQRVEQIVEQSLDFVRHHVLHRKEMPLIDVIQEAIESVRGSFTKVDFQVNMKKEIQGLKVHVDRKLFVQALQNILKNAAESYEGGSGKVVVTAEVSEEYSDIIRLTGAKDLKKKLGGDYTREFVTITIKDFGPGIAEEAREKIFTPFYTTKTKGTGIGLPISMKIIHSHEGIIDVISKEGKGTEFRVKIPVE